MLRIEHLSKVWGKGTIDERAALDRVSLHLESGDFLTVIGGNGSGKSTLLNTVAGVHMPDSGRIRIDGIDVTHLPEHKRASLVGRVFQDPLIGSAAGMTIEENLALAHRRGKQRSLRWGIRSEEQHTFRELLCQLGLGLEDRMSAKVGLLSGGQRQALTLLMAAVQSPKVLLLDEHTAALDPKTAAKVLELSAKIVAEQRLTTIMVTHSMKDALRYGNRLIMMDGGHIVHEAGGEAKSKLTVMDLLAMFHEDAAIAG